MERTLYLLRHAKSSWDDPSLEDRDRPLAPRGKRACQLVAAHLREERIVPELVLCSPARRARETLKRVAAGSTWPTLVDEGLYGAGGDELLARLRLLDDALASVMLVGHNPGLEELAAGLAGPGGDASLAGGLPTGALVTLHVDRGWAALAPGAATITALVRPRELDRRGS